MQHMVRIQAILQFLCGPMLLPYTKRETALGDSARMIVALHNLRVADKCKQKCVHKTINGPNTDCTDCKSN
jgi:hypothetical protein